MREVIPPCIGSTYPLLFSAKLLLEPAGSRERCNDRSSLPRTEEVAVLANETAKQAYEQRCVVALGLCWPAGSDIFDDVRHLFSTMVGLSCKLMEVFAIESTGYRTVSLFLSNRVKLSIRARLASAPKAFPIPNARVGLVRPN